MTLTPWNLTYSQWSKNLTMATDIYSNTVGYLRRKLGIELIKTVLIAVRGHRKSKTVKISALDLNLLSYYKAVKGLVFKVEHQSTGPGFRLVLLLQQRVKDLL